MTIFEKRSAAGTDADERVQVPVCEIVLAGESWFGECRDLVMFEAMGLEGFLDQAKMAVGGVAIQCGFALTFVGRVGLNSDGLS